MSLGPWEIGLILLVIIVLFGGKKLPELARSLGLGLKEFKKVTREISDDVQNTPEEVDNDEGFSKLLSQHADIYICDAFGLSPNSKAHTAAILRYKPKSGFDILDISA